MKSFMRINFVLAVVFSLGISTSVFAYDDVDGSPYKGAIMDLTELGVVQGYPNNLFLPEKEVSRAEFLKMAIETKGIMLDSSYQDCFPDVVDEWFAKYVCFSKNKGWVQGKADGNFDPHSTVTLAEAAKIVHRIFSDGAVIETINSKLETAEVWYVPYLDRYYELKIPQSLVDPMQLLDRAETAEILNRQIDEDLDREALIYNDFNFEADGVTVVTRLGYEYILDGGKVYFESYPADKLLPEAIAEKFRSLGNGIYSDGTRIYYRGEILSFTDAESFRVSGRYIFGNDGKIYGIAMYGEGITEVVGADYETFKGIFGEYDFLARDKNSIFSDTLKLEGSDPDSFEVLTEYVSYQGEGPGFRFARDKNQVYVISAWEGIRMGILEGADSQTFESVGGRVWKDKDGVFDVNGDQLAVDVATFDYSGGLQVPLIYEDRQWFGVLNFFKDKNGVYYYDPADDYVFKTLEKADPATFELVNEQFAKDAKDLFVYDFEVKDDVAVSSINVLENTSPEEFEAI